MTRANECTRPRPTERGFTLLEVMAVVAIMAILMGLVIFGIGKYRNKAYREGTKATILKVRNALEEYKSTHGDYPPDGYDTPVTVQGRGQIRGAQCLLFFLGLPTLKTAEYGDDVQVIEVDPFLDVTLDMLSRADNDTELVDLLRRADTALVDRYGNPLVYDNTAKDSSGRVRLSLQSDGGPDWRAANGGKARNPGTYDVYARAGELDDTEDDIWGDE